MTIFEDVPKKILTKCRSDARDELHQRVPRQRVTFSPDVQVELIYYENADKLRRWYSRADYRIIRQGDDTSLARMAKGLPESGCSCFRGLETQINDHKQTHLIEQSWDLVVEHADHRRQDQVAQEYSMLAYPCKIAAYQRGLVDAMNARGMMITPQTTDVIPRMPRRTWARAG